MPEDKNKISLGKSAVQVGIGLVIAMAIISLSWISKNSRQFPFYELIELRLLDQRFKIRGSIHFDPNVGTIDIDALSLSVEGRYQDWTRDKYADMVRTLKDLGARMIGFDVYFVEASSSEILKRQELEGVEINSKDDVLKLFKDYDEDFKEAIDYADNVILGQTFKVAEPQDPEWVRNNTVEKDVVKQRAVEVMSRYQNEYEGWDKQKLQMYIDIEPPIDKLVEVSEGVGYAMTVTDVDGSVRHYPVILVYDGKLWPSLSLMMVIDYIGVEFKDVEVIPGKEVILPPGKLPDGTEVNIRIPIDDKGLMMVNWAGNYHDAQFFHIPHSSLISNKKSWIRSEIAKELKNIFFEKPDALNDQDLLVQELNRRELEITQDLIDVYTTLGITAQIEAALAEDVVFDRDELGEDNYNHYLEIALNHEVVNTLKENPDLSLSKLSEKLGRPEDKISHIYLIVKDRAEKGGIQPQDYPLYFYDPELNGKILTAEDIKDKVFFYGLTAAGTWDLNPMPYAERYPMLGLHANIFNTIVTQNFLTRAPFWGDALILLFFGLLTGIAVPRMKPIIGGIAIVLILGGYLVTAQYVFESFGVWIDVLGAVGVIALGYTSITVYNFFSEEKEKKMIRGIFSRYVTKSVVDELIKNPEMVKLGGEKKVLTVFFSDVAGFTSLSEELSPEDLVAFLNEYLTAMTNIILRYDGMIDKYEGDAIMAVFGTPIMYEDHARRACYVSLEMQQELKTLREQWKADGKPDIVVRIGLNTGPMIAGNMGAQDRLDYTVMGDSVNLGSRLEGANKVYNTNIMISEFTYAQVKDDCYTRFLDSIKVKGKNLPVKVYELVGRKDTALPKELASMLEHFDNGMKKYLAKEWDDGIACFEKALSLVKDDGPSQLYVERCKNFKTNPPPADWDGVYTMTTK